MAFIFITKEKTNWKYILIIVILALIVAGESLLLLKQGTNIPETKLPQKVTQDETADWETYRNEEYGYELEYYKDWIYKKAGPYTYFFPEVYEGYLGTRLQGIAVQVFIWSEELNQPKGKKFDPEEYLCLEKCPREIIYFIPNKDNSKMVVMKLNVEEDRIFYYLSDSEIENVFHQMLSTFRFINPVADYFEGAELQYEGEVQKENIATALNDILNLSGKELKEKRYKNYTGKENQWDLPTLIYRHFVPKPPGTTLGDNFFHDVKSEKVREQVKQILENYFK